MLVLQRWDHFLFRSLFSFLFFFSTSQVGGAIRHLSTNSKELIKSVFLWTHDIKYVTEKIIIISMFFFFFSFCWLCMMWVCELCEILLCDRVLKAQAECELKKKTKTTRFATYGALLYIHRAVYKKKWPGWNRVERICQINIFFAAFNLCFVFCPLSVSFCLDAN